ncbi:MAG TPA: VOC family protein [Candidatus Didemnitutus sp.]|nr:VOC family protein [Candidatus Didemnitutus sp.]
MTRAILLVLLALGLPGLCSRAADVPPLNEPATAEKHPGKFIWSNLLTDNPDGAASFYSGLFGWTAATVELTTPKGARTEVVLRNGDRPVAGIVRRPALLQDNAHGRWVGYISVPDVAESVAIATRSGCHLISHARDVPARGTQAILADPEGAVIGLMHSSSGDPADYLAEPGDWAWAELFARNPESAGQFYRAIAGFECIPDTRFEKSNTLILTSGGYSRAGLSPVPARPKAHPVWVLFVRVADVKAAAAKAVQLGGRVLVPPGDTPTEFWRAIIADPSGAHLGLVELHETNSPEGQP